MRHQAIYELCLAFADAQAGWKSVCCIEAVHKIEPIFDKREVSGRKAKVCCHDDCYYLKMWCLAARYVVCEADGGHAARPLEQVTV